MHAPFFVVRQRTHTSSGSRDEHVWLSVFEGLESGVGSLGQGKKRKDRKEKRRSGLEGKLHITILEIAWKELF